MVGQTPSNRFAGWLEASMSSRGLSQAQLARSMGVADTQVSRWRRGQVVPSLQYLQRLADAFGVERVTLDRLVGLPVAEARSGRESADQPTDPALEAELQAYQARLREAMQRLPRPMWRAYMDACVALADGLGGSARELSLQAVREVDRQNPPGPDPGEPHGERHLGFRP
jgi:transcriptional regulator with XRE-family HTH domain